jgi:hypothetical protein
VARVENVKAQLDRVRFLSLEDPAWLETIHRQHETIVDRVLEGDADGASKAMSTHLNAVFDSIATIARASPAYFRHAAAPPDARSSRDARRTIAGRLRGSASPAHEAHVRHDDLPHPRHAGHRPARAPLRHSNGAHWGRFVRTIVEVETSDGYVGLGEMGGGGEDATRAFAALEGYLAGHDVFALEAMRLKVCNPTASLYNNRTQLHAALEFACLDIIGKKLGVPVHALLGGKLNDRVAFASYLFFRYADPRPARARCARPSSSSRTRRR